MFQFLATTPTLTKGFEEPTYIFKGVDNTLRCEFKSAPESVVTWFKDSRPITSGSSDLVLKNVQDDASGDYKCTGTNIKGNASSEARVYAIGMLIYY